MSYYFLWRLNGDNKWICVCGCGKNKPCCASREKVLPLGIRP